MLSSTAIALGTLVGAGIFLRGGHNAAQAAGQDAAVELWRDPQMKALSKQQLETERGWSGEETRNVWRVAEARAGARVYRSNDGRMPRVRLNRPLTRDEEMECRRYRAELLDETMRLPGHHPLNGDRDHWVKRQRGFGAYHPGLTRLERGSGGMPLPPTQDDWPNRYMINMEQQSH
jgi:hypothetical protein